MSRELVAVVKNTAGQPILKEFSDGTILILNVRVSHPHFDQPWAKAGDKPRFSGTAILPITSHKPAIKHLREYARKLILAGNKNVDIPDIMYFIRSGDDTKKPEYAGSWIIASGEETRPVVVNPDKTDMEISEIKSAIKAGFFIDMLIQPWFMDNKHGKRCNASLRMVRLRREGPLLTQSGINKDDAIGSFDDDDVEGGFGNISGAQKRDDLSDDLDDGMGGL